MGCGKYNFIGNNLITSYAHYNKLKRDRSYAAVDLSPYEEFSPSDIRGFIRPSCIDGIALSGNYRTLIINNEVTDGNLKGDLILSYDHWKKGQRHNYDHEHGIDYGHRENLFYKNRIHNNRAYNTLKEYNKQKNDTSKNQIYYQNYFTPTVLKRALLSRNQMVCLYNIPVHASTKDAGIAATLTSRLNNYRQHIQYHVPRAEVAEIGREDKNNQKDDIQPSEPGMAAHVKIVNGIVIHDISLIFWDKDGLDLTGSACFSRRGNAK